MILNSYKHYLTFIIIFCSGSSACNQTSHKKIYYKKVTFIKPTYVDTSILAIIPFEQFGNFIFDSSYKTAALTQSDLLETESLLQDCIKNYNDTHSKGDRQEQILYSSFRQYIAAINIKGEKEIWINCFCDTHGNDWKKMVMIVSDGGSCYFRLKVNLVEKKYYDLSINGEA